MTHSGQVDVGNDDLVEGRGGVFARLARVTARVVLVLGVAAGLPGLGVGSLCDGVLGRGRSGVAREVPASKTESAGHDSEKDLYGSKTLGQPIDSSCHWSGLRSGLRSHLSGIGARCLERVLTGLL